MGILLKAALPPKRRHITDYDRKVAIDMKFMGRKFTALLSLFIGLGNAISEATFNAMLNAIQDGKGVFEKPSIALLGPSGCSKTSTIFRVAQHHFVTYITCNAADGSGEIADRNYASMADDIKQIYEDVDMSLIYTWHETKFNKASRRVRLEYCARLLYLRKLFAAKRDLTPG